MKNRHSSCVWDKYFLVALCFCAFTALSTGAQAQVFYGYDQALGSGDNPDAAPYGGVARYVNPAGGVNSGAGTKAQPWANLDYALEHCTAGDTIYLRGGTHAYAVVVNNNVAATQAKPVEVRSYPGEWAIFDGTNVNNANHLLRIYYEAWLIFRNFEIKNSDKAGIGLEGTKDSEFHNIYTHSNNG